MQPIFPCQFAEDDGIHFNGLYIFATHQKTHVFKTLERIGQNVLLHISVCFGQKILEHFFVQIINGLFEPGMLQ